MVEASENEEHPTLMRVSSAGNVYGISVTTDEDFDGKSYSTNSSEPNNYDSSDVSDDEDDDYMDKNNSREHEDQLDQDDPGNFSNLTCVRLKGPGGI